WLCSLSGLNIYSQGVPQGINYQAVARDFTGEELANRNISVRISIISGSVDGQVEWIENHSVTTNRFGLFTIVIGQGEREGGDKEEFTDIYWGYSPHFLKVAIKFTESGEYLNLGTTQFFSVPYALYAEYAASGTGGGPVDPDDYDKDPTNEIQSLSIDTEHNELLLINPDGSEQSSLPIDYEPENEIQDLTINNNILTITKNEDANPVSLVPYLDNTDNQTLILEEDSIRISGGNAVYITELKNPESIYFYAEKTTTTSPVPVVSDIYLIFNEERVDQGDAYNHSSGDFNALSTGLYSFYFTYNAKTTQRVSIYINNGVYDILLQSAPSDAKVRYAFMLYLTADDKVNMVVNSGASTEIGTATFTGFKVY
ncbi:MAG: hypothetical protein JW770_07995, partial [Actinobacteria bacterium]|nr:hypothetical protein [Actinomycetota bacterium]